MSSCARQYKMDKKMTEKYLSILPSWKEGSQVKQIEATVTCMIIYICPSKREMGTEIEEKCDSLRWGGDKGRFYWRFGKWRQHVCFFSKGKICGVAVLGLASAKVLRVRKGTSGKCEQEFSRGQRWTHQMEDFLLIS